MGSAPLTYLVTFALLVGICAESTERQLFWKAQISPVGTCSACCSDQAAQTIKSLYSSVVAADCELANPFNYPPHYSPADGEVFDFVIVGAGSAGSVVANRLTEVSGWKVLLLEAGGNPTKTSEVPALFPFLQKSELDWQYQTEPDGMCCLGMEGNKCNLPRGKVLGGSSTINYMVYIRGNAKDFEQWAADGNTGWSYKDVLPYFKKSEDMRVKEVLATPDFSKYHSTGGYLSVENYENNEVIPLGNVYGNSMKELGYEHNPDYNGKTQTGFVSFQATLRDGRRCDTAKAFLTPIIKRTNLKVSKYSLVSKILIDNTKKTAYGVEFINKDGTVVKVRANKEIILSAGATNTPQLLMLSGIGPRKHLEGLNIEVIQDLPVGENLQDHLLMGGLVVSHNYSIPSETPEESMFDFLLKRNSRYSGIGLASYGGFINTVKGVDYPDIEALVLSFDQNDKGGLFGLLSLFGYRDEIKQKYLEIIPNSPVFLAMNSLLRPYARGKIQLRSTNPKERPKITSVCATDQRDIETFLRTYDFISELVQTKSLKSVNATLHEIDVPQCSKIEVLGSRKYRECVLRHITTTTYHYSSSCKMGPASSPDSVVDPRLRVKGIDRLRVIDASIMPNITSGNINAAVIMVGEKGSDLVKETWLPTKH